MLGPPNLPSAHIKVALKPTAGWEQQLYISTAECTEPGVFSIQGLNSGVYSGSVPDAAVLAATPQELLVICDTEIKSQANIVVTVTGIDHNDQAFIGTATIKPPSHASFQEKVFPKGYAVDVLPVTASQKCKSITSVSVAALADTAFSKLRIVGVPSFDIPQSATGAYRLVSTKVKLDVTPKVPMPHPVQDGRDKSAFVKLGEIPEGAVNCTSKDPADADGMARMNGVRSTGLVRVIKEGKVETRRQYLLGLTITAKPSAGESVEDVQWEGSGFYEVEANVLAM